MKKRIISLSVGLAMLLNMATVLPASIFAESVDNNAPSELMYNGHKYQLFDNQMYWNDAEAYCESLGGHLAVITDEEEKKAVEEYASDQGKKQIYWLGATDQLKEGDWKWVTGEDTSLIKKYGCFDNMGGAENCLALTNPSSWYWNDWANIGNDGNPVGMYAYENLGFICEWDEEKIEIQKDKSMDYTVFSGNPDETLQLYSYKNDISGNVYCGSFFSSCSILNIKGKLDSTSNAFIYGWLSSVDECNRNTESIAMPDWDNRITKAAGAYEYTQDSIYKIEDKNIIEGSLVSGGSVEISGTTFSGDCYIIANGDITYNVSNFESKGRVVLYSKNGNITIHGNNIDFNGIMYAPNGKITLNTNVTNVNGRLFADSFNFSGSQLNINSSDSDWELLGANNIVTKTYTTDKDFNEGSLNDIGLDVKDELTLKKTDDYNGENVKEYDLDLENNKISVKETVSKQYITSDEKDVNVKLDFLTDGTSRYELFNEDVSSWSQAKAKCEKLGGHLVTVSDENEWNTVRKLFEDECVDERYHLWMGGYYDTSDNEWKWVDGTPFEYSEWDRDAGEPMNDYRDGKYEHYLMCYRIKNPYNSSSVPYKWNSLYDTGIQDGIYSPDRFCYICEWDNKPSANGLDFSTTVKNIDDVDTQKITPAPEKIEENADGSSTITWKNVSETISVPFMSADVSSNKSLLLYDSIIRSGVSEKKIDQTSVPIRAFTQDGSWKDVYSAEEINGIELSVGTNKKTVNKPSDNVNLEFSLNGFGVEQIEENNVDLAIVIDTSGSMGGQKMTNAKSSANEVIGHMKSNDRCEIIGFNSSAAINQKFTSDQELLKSAVSSFKATGGTNIQHAIQKAVEGFKDLGDSTRQKYIILLSDGEDNSKSAAAATEAYTDNGITIFALSVGNKSTQMETIAKNANGKYLVSSSPEEIDDLMQQFAAEVFDISGKQAVFEITVPGSVQADVTGIEPAADEIVSNPDGSSTYRWKYDTVSIDENKKIVVPVSLTDTNQGIIRAASDISCTYLNRDGDKVKVAADDIVLSVNEYVSEGTWETVYDSNCADTVWSEIFWNGMLYDDSRIIVQASVSDDNITYSQWYDVNNHEELNDLKGQYIRLKVTEVRSSTGKTPELFDISVYSKGADSAGYINNPPSASISGPDRVCANKNIVLQASADDDAFSNGLSFEWSCEDAAAEFSDSDKPYTAVKFSKPGEYTVNLKVSDGSSESVISRKVVVFSSPALIAPEIRIDVPEYVKGGAAVSGSITNINSLEIKKYTVSSQNTEIICDADGKFTFNAPLEDSEIIISAKATASNGLSASAAASVQVDATKPDVKLNSDVADVVNPGDKITLTPYAYDSNGIGRKVLKINGEEVIPENSQYEFIAQENTKYVIEFWAEDIVGNENSDSVTITAGEKKTDENPGPNVFYTIPKVLSCGQTGNFNFTGDPTTQKLLVSLNGNQVDLDENGSFSYTPDKIGDIRLDVYAENSEGKKTEFQLTVKVVSINLTGKDKWADNEPVKLSVSYSDNVVVKEESILIDDIKYDINADGTVIAEGLGIGGHKAVLYVKDEDDFIYVGEISFSVVDVTRPDVTVTMAKTDLTEGDTAEASVTVTDNVGVDSVQVLVDGKDHVLSDKNTVIIENISAGKHAIEVIVSDAAGNKNSKVYEFSVAGKQAVSQISVEASASYNKDKLISVKADVTGTNEAYTLYGTINGEKIEFCDNIAKFQAKAGCDYNITVVAEDSNGKSVSSLKISIPDDDPEYKYSISAEADKTTVSAGETVKFLVRSNSLMGNDTVTCKADGGKTAFEDGAFTFVSVVPGVYAVVFTATDADGNTAEDTVVITVADNDDCSEEIDEYVSPFIPETESRTFVKSSEPTETKITEEMQKLADNLGTPLAVYEYLYNSINTEFYMGSKKGAVGAYEQKGANDVDSASLLIAMLRYLGCKAEYVTGSVGMTGGQLMDLTGADSVEKALEIYTLQLNGVTYKYSGSTYYFTHTWVRATVDGTEHDLDISFKKYKHVDGIAEIAENGKCDLDFSNYTSADTGKLLSDVNGYIDSMESEKETEINVTGKKIVNRKFSKLPSSLHYVCDSEDEVIGNINSSKRIATDSISFKISGSGYKISGPDAYLSSIKLAYVPYDIFNDEPYDPEDIYDSNLNQSVYLSLFVNDKNVYMWEREKHLGEKQDIEITEVSSGFTYKETKNLLVGSVNSIVSDQQNVSPQSLKTSYESAVLSDSESSALDKNGNLVYSDKYIGDYLDLIGNMYFSYSDVMNKSIAGAKKVFAERSMSYGVFSYNPDVTITSMLGYQTASIERKGSFMVDIIGNYGHCTSYGPDNKDSNDYILMSGYMGSYYESYILEIMTGIESVSTAKVFDLCGRNDIDINVICSDNIDQINQLNISDENKDAIKTEVQSGKTVLVPEKNITLNSWTGTGYIVIDQGKEVIFKLSDNTNGGASTGDAYCDYLCVLTSTVIDLVDEFRLLMVAVDLLLTGNIIGGVIVLGITFALIYATLDFYTDSLNLYLDVASGSETAEQSAAELQQNAKMAAIFTAIGLVAGPAAKKAGSAIAVVGEKLAKVKFINKIGAVLKKVGKPIADAVVDKIGKANSFLRRTNVYNKFITKQVEEELAAEIVIREYSDDILEKVCSSDNPGLAAKYLKDAPEEYIEFLNKSVNPEFNIKLVTDFGEDGIKASVKGGDQVLEAIYGSGLSASNQKKALKLIIDIEDNAVEAIKKSGNKAVEVLAKVPSKECAQLIGKYGDDALKVISDYGDDAVKAISGCDAPYEAIKIIKNGGTAYGEQAMRAIKQSGNKAVEALTKVPSKQCADIIVKYGDNAADAINVITRPELYEDAVSQISLYGEDAIKVIKSYGNDAVKAIGKCSRSPKNAIEVMKNDLIGKKAANAIKITGDNAVDALLKVPNGDYADLIAKDGDVATRFALEGGEDTVNAYIRLDNLGNTYSKNFKNTIKQQNKEFIEALEKCSFTDDAVEMIGHYKNDGVKIFNNISNKNVKGLSEALESGCNDVTFAIDSSNNCFVAGSGTSSVNPTIKGLPDNYFDGISSENDFVKAHKKIFTEEYVKGLDVDDSIKDELNKLNEALENTRKKAEEAGAIYGANFKNPYPDIEYSLEEDWPVFNCGEVWSAREAILNGTKFDDLRFYSVNNQGGGTFKEMCDNCKITFAGKEFILQ